MLRKKQGECSVAVVILIQNPSLENLIPQMWRAWRPSCASQRVTQAQAMSDDEVG